MKKLLLGLSVIITFSISSSFTPAQNESLATTQTKIENVACKYGQCMATAKSTGKRCKHCVSNSGDSYCWQHK